jgi:hypothetical protein
VRRQIAARMGQFSPAPGAGAGAQS